MGCMILRRIFLNNYSYSDYLEIDKNVDERVELISHKVYMMAGMSALHQDIVLNIALILKNIVKDKN